MRYEQPTIAPLASALDSIQGSSNKGKSAVDNSDHIATVAAYEADE